MLLANNRSLVLWHVAWLIRCRDLITDSILVDPLAFKALLERFNLIPATTSTMYDTWLESIKKFTKDHRYLTKARCCPQREEMRSATAHL